MYYAVVYLYFISTLYSLADRVYITDKYMSNKF